MSVLDRATCLVVTFLVFSSCKGEGCPSSCPAGQECASGMSTCLVVCEADEGCGTGEICVRGLCWPGARLTASDGNGSDEPPLADGKPGDPGDPVGGESPPPGDFPGELCGSFCSCSPGETCAFECQTSDCIANCSPGATCSLLCLDAPCYIACSNGATCGVDCPNLAHPCSIEDTCENNQGCQVTCRDSRIMSGCSFFSN